MTSIEQLHRQASQLHRAGQLAGAEQLCRQILADQPAHAPTLHLMSQLAFQLGRPEEALAHLQKAVDCDPTAEAHTILGNRLQELGRLDEAIGCFQNATRLRPDLMAAHYNLGNVLRSAGQYQAAAASYRQALLLTPEFAQAHNNLGTVLQTLGDNDAAANAFAEAVRLAPESAEAYHNLGTLMKQSGKLAQARTLLLRAIELDPGHAPSHFNLGGTLFELGEWDQVRPCYLEALRLRPNYAEPHCSLGVLRMAKGEYDEALGHFDRALAIQPALAEARCDRGMLRLVQGDFAAGWPDYQWCRQTPGVQERLPGPQWDGSPLDGCSILLYVEQGYGDSLQFIRYAPLVKARGGRVIVACPERLSRILGTCRGIDEFYSFHSGHPPPPFHVHAALTNLPGIFRADLDSIPADVPYLSAGAERVEQWRKQLGDDGSFRVGINWQGNPNYGWDQYRSVPLAQFAPLGEIERVRLFSLQKGFGIEQLALAPFAVEDLGSRLDHDAAFCDTAAVIRNLDLVVTSDTALAHLAGALGAPVWMALPFGPDWRWLLDREDSPWYPTMRLFRQPKFGDWPAVFERIAGELRKAVAASRADPRPPDDF